MLKKLFTVGFIATFILVMPLSGCTNSSKNNNANSEDTESEFFKKFDVQYTSMEDAERKLIEIFESKGDDYIYYSEMIDFVLKEDKTIDYPFNLLREKTSIDFVTSDDGNLRLYYWDSGMGGTWILWNNICQYRDSEGKIHSYKGYVMDAKYEIYDPGYEGDNSCAIMDIKTIYDNDNKPIYLVHCYIRESSNWGYSGIEAIKIENGKLVAAPIFIKENDSFNKYEYTEEKEILYESCYIGTEYTIAGWYFRANKGEGWDWLFRYDRNTNTLYVPQARPEISDRYSMYHFNGEVFSYVGTDGGFWLHPSLRSFEFLEYIIETKDYRIRVDRMYDGTYRYASWKKPATMDSLPDLILYNGTREDDTDNYTFKNDGYKYIICSSDGMFRIEHHGKIILSQGFDY